MNVVIAIDSFKGSMTSMQAGLSAATGIKRVYKDAHITVLWRTAGRAPSMLW